MDLRPGQRYRIPPGIVVTAEASGDPDRPWQLTAPGGFARWVVAADGRIHSVFAMGKKRLELRQTALTADDLVPETAALGTETATERGQTPEIAGTTNTR